MNLLTLFGSIWWRKSPWSPGGVISAECFFLCNRYTNHLICRLVDKLDRQKATEFCFSQSAHQTGFVTAFSRSLLSTNWDDIGLVGFQGAPTNTKKAHLALKGGTGRKRQKTEKQTPRRKTLFSRFLPVNFGHKMAPCMSLASNNYKPKAVQVAPSSQT